jgi:hypothetical protein
MRSYISIQNYYQIVSKKITLCLLAFMLTIFVFGCGPSAGVFELVDNNLEFEIITEEDTLANGNTAVVSEYVLKPPMNIQNVEYDNSANIFLIKYLNGEENFFTVCSLEDNKTLWNAKSDMKFTLLQNNNLILNDPISGKLYDAQTGQFVRDIEPYLYLNSEKGTLQLSPEKFAQLDIRTGKKYWESDGTEWVGYREDFLDEDYCYVIAEGLHAIKYDEGKKWEYLTSTSYRDVAKEVATQVALSCLFALAGSYSAPASNPDITMNMNSQPLVIENEIYFAARDKIVCLDKTSGKLIWESQIDPELESMRLYDISETEIALVGKGIKILNYALKESDPPTIRIINKTDGKMVGLFSMDKEDIVQSFFSTDENLLLLTPNQLMVFDMELKMLGISESRREYGNFIDILSAADTIVLRTAKGILGISKDDLSEVYFNYCEIPRVDVNDEWRKPIDQKFKNDNQSFYQSGYYWTPNENDGVSAFNENTWEPSTEIELYGNSIKQFDNKYIDFVDNKIIIVSFK